MLSVLALQGDNPAPVRPCSFFLYLQRVKLRQGPSVVKTKTDDYVFAMRAAPIWIFEEHHIFSAFQTFKAVAVKDDQHLKIVSYEKVCQGPTRFILSFLPADSQL